jgi:hypothetical protein
MDSLTVDCVATSTRVLVGLTYLRTFTQIGPRAFYGRRCTSKAMVETSVSSFITCLGVTRYNVGS